MHKALTAAALTLLVVPLMASTTSAQSMQRRHALTAQQLQQVEAARSRQTALPAQVARQGTLRVTATFTKHTAFSLPVQCSADISIIPLSDPSGVVPSELMQSQTVQFTGRAGTCTLSMDYNWPSIDSNSLLFVTLSVITDPQAYYRNGSLARPIANVITMSKDWILNGNTPVPPANGLTVYDFGNLTL